LEWFGLGGTADYTECLARALAQKGDEVLVVTSTAFRASDTSPEFSTACVFDYSPNHAKARKAMQLGVGLLRARKVIEGFKPDVVHVQGTILPLLEGAFHRTLGSFATVCTVHDVVGHEHRPWLGSYERFYAKFDCLICHSETSARQLRKRLAGVPSRVIPHGSYEFLAGSETTKEGARQRLNIPLDARVVLLFGFIRRYKGLDLLLDALMLAKRNERPMLALVAGRPLYNISASVERARRDELAVIWHPSYIPREDIGLFFSASDIVVLPYLDTSDSGAFELAVAYGKPVVVTAAGGLAEAFDTYRFGAVVPRNNASLLATALGRDYVRGANTRNNSWTAVADSTRAVYRDVTRGSAGRSA